MQEAVRLHHRVEPHDESVSRLVNIVSLADRILFDEGDHGLQGHGYAPVEDADIARVTGLRVSEVPAIRRRIEELATEAAAMFY